MDFTEFVNEVRRGIEEIARDHSLFEIAGDEYRMRPAISWELKEEYFFIRIRRTQIDEYVIKMGFYDPDDIGTVFLADGVQEFRSLNKHITPLILSRDIKTLLGELREQFRKVIAAVSEMRCNASFTAYNWDSTIYSLMKWIDGQDDMLKRLIYRKKNQPLIVKIARLMGREEEVRRVLRNIEAGKEITGDA